MTEEKKSRLPSVTLIAVLAVIGALGGVFWRSLNPGPGYDPAVNRDIPVFATVSPLNPAVSLTTKDIKENAPALVNIWASWCAPCRAEHPQLTALADKGVKIYGLNYKDKKANAQKFLTEHGNPFTKIGADESGRVGIDWGLRGVPETFIIGKDGKIIHRHVGEIHPENVAEILDLLKEEGFSEKTSEMIEGE